MSQQELLIKIVEILNCAGLPYMVTGSVASSLQGEPRSTHDIDIVVSIRLQEAKKLIELISQYNFYIDDQSVTTAIEQGEMFNVIDPREGSKVDFWMLTDEPFDKSRFTRRQTEEFMGTSLWVSKPEDTILAKLKWAKLSGGSEKQFTDALRVYELQYNKLDLNYIEHWSTMLDIKQLLEQLKSKATFLPFTEEGA